MKAITICSAKCRGNPRNTRYPLIHNVTNAEELKEAVSYDHVCGMYLKNHRSNRDFEWADGLMFDVDNDHSDNPDDFMIPADIEKGLPGVPFYVVYSRHHNLPKGGKSARPRFHVYFPIDTIRDVKEYVALKNSIADFFPCFDRAANDGARFFFGIKDPVVEVYGGDEACR